MGDSSLRLSKFGGRIGLQTNLVDSPKSSFHLPTENGTPPKSTVNGGPSCSHGTANTGHNDGFLVAFGLS